MSESVCDAAGTPLLQPYLPAWGHEGVGRTVCSSTPGLKLPMAQKWAAAAGLECRPGR